MSASASALLLQQAGEAALQAMTHEKEGRDEAALAGMQRAAELILAVVRGGGCDAAQQQKLTARAREYLGKAEQLRARIDSRRAQQPASCRHEKTIEVAEGQTGCSYEVRAGKTTKQHLLEHGGTDVVVDDVG